MKSSPARVTAVTGGLVVAGGLFGALAAAAGTAIALAITRIPIDASDPTVIGVAAVMGGMLGAPLLPAASWLLLRRVPLGLSWLGTTIGAVVGGVLGWIAAVAVQGDLIIWPVLAALIGFFAAVIILRWKF